MASLSPVPHHLRRLEIAITVNSNFEMPRQLRLFAGHRLLAFLRSQPAEPRTVHVVGG
jgi:hypothetical protein